MMRFPAFIRPGRAAVGLDNFTGASLRVSGVGAILLALLGAVYLSWSLYLLVRLQTGGDSTGWDGLIAAIGIMLGGGMLVSGALLTLASHVAFRGWVTGNRRPVFTVAIVLVVIGATFWMPYAWQTYNAPLDLYLMVARLVLFIWGGLLLVWARWPNRSPAHLA